MFTRINYPGCQTTLIQVTQLCSSCARNVNSDGSLNITDAYEDTTTCKQFEAS